MKSENIAISLIVVLIVLVAFVIGLQLGKPNKDEQYKINDYSHLQEICDNRKTLIIAQQTAIKKLDVEHTVNDDCVQYLYEKAEIEYAY